MASAGSARTDNNASHSSNRDIETIVEEFTGESSPGARTPTSAESSSSLVTPTAKSSLAKKLAKSLGFSGNSKASTSEGSPSRSATGAGDRQNDSKQQSDRGVHFGGASQNAAMQGATVSTSAPPAAIPSTLSGNSGSTQTAKVVSPFQNVQETTLKGESSTFYSPSTSFISVISSRPSKAMSSTLEEEASQARKSPLGLANLATRSGELVETKKGRLTLLESPPGDERTASGGLAGKSRRSSLTYSVKSSGMSLLGCSY